VFFLVVCRLFNAHTVGENVKQFTLLAKTERQYSERYCLYLKTVLYRWLKNIFIGCSVCLDAGGPAFSTVL
jgi:hypothetical protein